MGNDNAKAPHHSSGSFTAKSFDDIEEDRLKHTFKTLNGGTKSTLTQDDFEHGLCSAFPEYGRRLFNNITCPSVNEERFVEWGKNVLSLMTLSQHVEFYISLFSDQGTHITVLECEQLCVCCFKASQCVAGMFTADNVAQSAELIALLKSMFSNEETVSCGEMNAWCARHCKKLFETLHFYTASVLRGDLSLGRRTDGASAEGSPFGSKLSGTLLSPCLAWLLSCHLPSCYIPSIDHDLGALAAFSSSLAGIVHPSGWQLLYSSDLHGAGKTRFVHHLLDYTAPTVLLLSFEEHVYIVAADMEWKESSRRWGGDDCVLIQVLPTYRQMTAGPNLLWFNLDDRTVPKGLSVGRDARTTFIEIDDDFSNVMHYGVPCKLQAVEVWGCGGMRALDEQKKQQVWEQQQVEKAKGRKLKLEDWRDNPDQQLLNLGGVDTEHAKRGDV